MDLLPQVRTALALCSELSRWLTEVRSVRRLGGLTNQNLLVETEAAKYVLRLPGQGTEEYISRALERHAALLTSELGVNALVYFFDEKSGIQLCRFLEKAVTMDAEKFRDRSAIARAAQSFRRVHEAGQLFLNRFDLFAMVEGYLTLLERKGASLPEDFLEAKQAAEKVRTAIALHPIALVPCHCDPLAENFLDTGEKMFIVDWEYSGNHDPMWDLADLAVEASFDAAQETVLLESYFDGKVPAFARGRVTLYKAMCDLLWTLWGVIQHVNQNSADDFWAYAVRRFGRCRTLMKAPEFEVALRAVEIGPTA